MKLPDIDELGTWAIQAILITSVVAFVAVNAFKFILSEFAN